MLPGMPMQVEVLPQAVLQCFAGLAYGKLDPKTADFDLVLAI
jgi:hypothetical protein